MSQYDKVMKVLALSEGFQNPEVNNAIRSAKKTFIISVERYKQDEDAFNENVNVDDEIADLSVVLLSAADVYGDFEEEIEIRSLLEMIWSEDNDEDYDDDEGSE